MSAEPRRCARQVIDLATPENCAVSAVQATREHLIHQYGTLTGRRVAQRSDVYAIEEIIEKPNPTLAELRLQVAGLRVGHYLCFFGIHVLSPTVFELLDGMVNGTFASSGRSSSPRHCIALARQGEIPGDRDPGLAVQPGSEVWGRRAQIALAMAGVDREQILAVLVETLTRLEQNSTGNPAGRETGRSETPAPSARITWLHR